MTTPIDYQQAREQCMEIIMAIKALREHPAVRANMTCLDRTDSARQSINDIYMLLGADGFIQECKQNTRTNSSQKP